MKRILTLNLALLLACGFSMTANAQEGTKTSNDEPRYNFSPAFEFLRSTHGNYFNGPSFKVTRNLESRFKPGIGIGYATTKLHFDNALLLHNMKLIPIYANVSYDITNKSKFEPFAEASAGITFLRYDRSSEADPLTVNRINERGLYLYGGFGVRYKVTNRIAPYVSAGFKGFNNTLNDLDINPHGITFQAGVRF